jgi:RimJ/RimL family protein N-acetyltransferase
MAKKHPSIYDHVPIGPFESAEHFVSIVIDKWVQPDPNTIVFAVYDLTSFAEISEDVSPKNLPGNAFAGIFGLTRTQLENLSTELGWALIFPPFQRTHVTTHAIAMLVDYCLTLSTSDAVHVFLPLCGANAPTSSTPRGLGLRRVAWTTSPHNEASIRAAKRMGFQHEATLRWGRVFPERFQSNLLFKQPHKGDPKKSNPGQDVVVMSICWDDWENGGREKARIMMERI